MATCHPDRQLCANGLCKPCYQVWWRKTNPEKRQVYQHRYTYNISSQDFDNMMVEQKKCCALCRKLFGDDRPVIEHNHETGFVRGLVHYWCNTRLTAIEDKDFLEHALRYLKDAQRRYDEQGSTIRSDRGFRKNVGQEV
jgi:hypothetical protein